MLFCFLASDICHAEFFRDRLEDSVAPVTTDAWPILAVGGGLTLGLYLVKQPSRFFQRELGESKPFGKFSKIGDLGGTLLPNFVYAAAYGLHYLFQSDNESLRNVLLMVETSAYAVALSTILKFTVREQRPGGSTNKQSFPSGHATAAFAFSSVVTGRHHWGWAIAANSFATYVAASRLNDNRHFLHDVVAGATIGLSYGIGLNFVWKKRWMKEDADNKYVSASAPRISLYPEISTDTRAVMIKATF